MAAYLGHLDVVCWFDANVRKSTVLRDAAANGHPELFYQVVTTFSESVAPTTRMEMCQVCFFSTLKDRETDIL